MAEKFPYVSELIYGRVLRIEAQKIGPHRCDQGCRDADHRYYHDFDDDTEVKAFGMSDGSVWLKGLKKIWGMF
jgi:hypothetical protein